jgi:hypothetical protein
VNTAFSVLDPDEHIVVAGHAGTCPTNILRAIGANLSPVSRQSCVNPFDGLVTDNTKPSKGSINWTGVSARDRLHLNRRRLPTVGTICAKMLAEIIFEIGANSFDTSALSPAQVDMTHAKIEHLSQELLETEPGELNGLSARQNLDKMPTARRNNRSDYSKFD